MRLCTPNLSLRTLQVKSQQPPTKIHDLHYSIHGGGAGIISNLIVDLRVGHGDQV